MKAMRIFTRLLRLEQLPTSLREWDTTGSFRESGESSGKTYLPPEISKMIDERSPDELSAREREVLLLMAEGMSNRDIAAELGIAEKTVKCHVGMILSLFGVKDRTNAVLTAIRRGYVKL